MKKTKFIFMSGLLFLLSCNKSGKVDTLTAKGSEGVQLPSAETQNFSDPVPTNIGASSAACSYDAMVSILNAPVRVGIPASVGVVISNKKGDCDYFKVQGNNTSFTYSFVFDKTYTSNGQILDSLIINAYKSSGDLVSAKLVTFNVIVGNPEPTPGASSSPSPQSSPSCTVNKIAPVLHTGDPLLVAVSIQNLNGLPFTLSVNGIATQPNAPVSIPAINPILGMYAINAYGTYEQAGGMIYSFTCSLNFQAPTCSISATADPLVYGKYNLQVPLYGQINTLNMNGQLVTPLPVPPNNTAAVSVNVPVNQATGSFNGIVTGPNGDVGQCSTSFTLPPPPLITLSGDVMHDFLYTSGYRSNLMQKQVVTGVGNGNATNHRLMFDAITSERITTDTTAPRVNSCSAGEVVTGWRAGYSSVNRGPIGVYCTRLLQNFELFDEEVLKSDYERGSYAHCSQDRVVTSARRLATGQLSLEIKCSKVRRSQ